MSDTHGIFFLGSLNHPDVEAAFLRRFNPVYFPLPNDQQRVHMLEETIPHSGLSEPEFRRIIVRLKDGTKGFNYSGLALIQEYLINIARSRGYEHITEDIPPDVYELCLQEALAKARQRTPLESLDQFDHSAQEMVNHNKRRIPMAEVLMRHKL